jgi:NADH:ubiquinone reductase (H+-translocating)
MMNSRAASEPFGRQQVVIVGGGFGGLHAALRLARQRELEITLIDQRNHHLFQPLLYQVATAGLGAEAIAVPIRSVLSRFRNVRVLRTRAVAVDIHKAELQSEAGRHVYDYLLLACGAVHSYFGNEEWEAFAPGLKTVEQALEVRRRILTAFEEAEKESDPQARRRLLTFAVIGGGPTGVELAGAIGEISRFVLARDFRNIDPKLARVVLIEAGPRILPSFSEKQASRAVRDLESLGVQVWTSSRVTRVDRDGVEIGSERILCATALWAAGVQASPLGLTLGCALDPSGRVPVGPDLSLPGYPEIFVLGDQALARNPDSGRPFPGLAPVAVQQGRFAARQIANDLAGRPRERFRYVDRGNLATIGRNRAVGQVGRLGVSGWAAWLLWLMVHIYSLIGFHNRVLVLFQWAWAHVTFRRGARLVVEEEWRFHAADDAA